jgi:hypothetical protein
VLNLIKNWLLNNVPSGLNDLEEGLVLAAFDTETGFDIQKIEKEMKSINFLKRVAFVKLTLFVPEYVLTYLLFSKKYSTSKKELAKLYYKFLFNEINLDKFKIKLNLLIKDGII